MLYQYLQYATLLLGLTGLWICIYIARKKSKGENLVCTIDHNCTDVVNSAFGKTFGIENTLLGGLYYALVALVSLAVIISGPYYMENFWLYNSDWSPELMIYPAIGASLFSFYLMYVMRFKLKERCDWCIGSAVVANLITIIYLLEHFWPTAMHY